MVCGPTSCWKRCQGTRQGPDAERWLTDFGLRDYLRKEVPRFMTREMQVRGTQTPQAILSGSNSFRIRQVPRPPTCLPMRPWRGSSCGTTASSSRGLRRSDPPAQRLPARLPHGARSALESARAGVSFARRRGRQGAAKSLSKRERRSDSSARTSERSSTRWIRRRSDKSSETGQNPRTRPSISSGDGSICGRVGRPIARQSMSSGTSSSGWWWSSTAWRTPSMRWSIGWRISVKRRWPCRRR